MYTLSTFVEEIPPLFCQLDVLQRNQSGEYTCWKEKARWIRFEEEAEEVLGRWTKPRVATIPQVAMEGLKEMVNDSMPIFNLQISENKEIGECITESLDEYLNGDPQNKAQFLEIFNLPHFHHHQKNIEKSLSQYNLFKLASSSATLISQSENDHKQHESIESPFGSSADFKENLKFKKKVNKKAEAASILVTPLDFVTGYKIVIVRMQSAALIPSFLELNLSSRFLVSIIGPTNKQAYLYEMGRAMATILADDFCRELFYSAQTKNDILSAIDHLNKSTVLIPPSEWDPKIQIEPPLKYRSKKDRLAKPEITDYMHDSNIHVEDHCDPSMVADKRPFIGVMTDIKRKLPWYISDITDALNVQCVAVRVYTL